MPKPWHNHSDRWEKYSRCKHPHWVTDPPTCATQSIHNNIVSHRTILHARLINPIDIGYRPSQKVPCVSQRLDRRVWPSIILGLCRSRARMDWRGCRVFGRGSDSGSTVHCFSHQLPSWLGNTRGRRRAGRAASLSQQSAMLSKR